MFSTCDIECSVHGLAPLCCVETGVTYANAPNGLREVLFALVLHLGLLHESKGPTRYAARVRVPGMSVYAHARMNIVMKLLEIFIAKDWNRKIWVFCWKYHHPCAWRAFERWAWQTKRQTVRAVVQKLELIVGSWRVVGNGAVVGFRVTPCSPPRQQSSDDFSLASINGKILWSHVMWSVCQEDNIMWMAAVLA